MAATAMAVAEEPARIGEESRRVLAALASLKDGFVIYDKAGMQISANPAVRRLYPRMGDLFEVGVSLERQLREGSRRGQFQLEGEPRATWLRRQTIPFHRGGRILLHTTENRHIEVLHSGAQWGDRTAMHRDVTPLIDALEESRREAETDALTGLPNRRGFFRKAEELLAQHGASAFAALLVDIDRFKKLNDQLGHLAGDAVLTAFADRLRAACPAEASIGRLGGDEFAAVVPLENPGQAMLIAEAIVGMARPPIAWETGALATRCSVGVAITRVRHSDTAIRTLDTLLAEADGALYRAKHGGGNRWNCAASDWIPCWTSEKPKAEPSPLHCKTGQHSRIASRIA